MNKTLILLSLFCATSIYGDTNTQENVLCCVSNALQTLKAQLGERELKDIECEPLCFEHGLSQEQNYTTFTATITNSWQEIITNINQISTNYIDKFLIFSTGKQGDEELYLHYYETLARMRMSDEIDSRDLFAFHAVTRYDLLSLLRRRYQEPAVSNLVETLKMAAPEQTNTWNKILSGEAYLEYLGEAECGQWGSNPPL